MSNLLNLADSVNFAWSTGKTPTFTYNSGVYDFSPQGLIDFITIESNLVATASSPTFATLSLTELPTADPEVAGALWVDAAASFVVKVSQGA
jgi:hypothetical protein